MKPIKFLEQNIVYAKDQRPYLPLPAFKDEECTISCWSLSWKERFKVLFGGVIWLRVLNFSEPLQPQLLEVDKPFVTNA